MATCGSMLRIRSNRLLRDRRYVRDDSGSARALELARVQVVVKAAQGKQLFVPATLDDAAIVDDLHLIGVANRAETVRDESWYGTPSGTATRPRCGAPCGY